MIKLFEDFNEIHDICEEYNIYNYTINSDGTIDVHDDVDLFELNLTKIPLKFNRIVGDFVCHYNNLTSLEGAPKHIQSSFFCSNNRLVSLEDSPLKVDGTFDCQNNSLVTLKGAPKEISGEFRYGFNNLPEILIYDEHIKYILANQEDYGIWNRDGSFNTARFDIMMNDRDL